MQEGNMEQLTKEQIDKVVEGMNMILVAIGAPTIDELLAQQESIAVLLPPAQRATFMEAIKMQTAQSLAGTFGAATNTFKQQLDKAIKEKRDDSETEA